MDANGSTAIKDNVPILMYQCFPNNPSQLGWTLADGGLSWNNQYCAYRDAGSSYLVFGKCSDKPRDAKDFLGSKFRGHPSHKFVAYDEQDMHVAKTDADIHHEEEN
jgi:hypothetical protein